ncbi:hypothetical protein HDU96_001856 [Phlyctochytrium bullatum]|nr:hypothetical protein HDU96_001856 [Phlyctochytrium bullatum]
MPTPAFGNTSPRLGHRSFPIDLLPSILIHLHLNDLPTLAAANRHLRLAVAAATTFTFANRHLTAIAYKTESKASALAKKATSQAIDLDAIAVVTMHAVSIKPCRRVWSMQRKAKPIVKDLREARLRAVRTAIQNNWWPGPRAQTVSTAQIAAAFAVAALMRSLDLLDDLCSRFPVAVGAGLRTIPMQTFLWSCAAEGFVKGSKMIPHNHPILNIRLQRDCGFDKHDRTLLEEASFSRYKAVKVLLDLGAAVNTDIPDAVANYCRPVGVPVRARVLAAASAVTGTDPLRVRSSPPVVISVLGAGVMLAPLEPAEEIRDAVDTGIDRLDENRDSGHVVAEDASDVPPADPAGGRGAGQVLDFKLHSLVAFWAGRDDATEVGPKILLELLDLGGGNSILREEIIKSLRQIGGLKVFPLHAALAAGCTDEAAVLLDAGANPRRRSKSGRAVLHFVAEVERWCDALEPLLDRLLRMGVEVNARDAKGRTALHAASSRGRREYLEWLLARDGIDGGLLDDKANSYMDLWPWESDCPRRNE